MIRIAIDGPSGAGKSTMARILAKELRIDHVDTGAMYRAIALKILRSGIDCENPEALSALLAATDVDYSAGSIFLDGEKVDALIRTPEVSEAASATSAIPAVREKLVALQREMGERKSLVMDGRDIGSNVLRDAEYKFYLDASVDVRARRRTLEMEERGETVDFLKTKAEMEARDFRDMHRENNPLIKADGAIVIDSSDMTVQEVVDELLKHIRT